MKLITFNIRIQVEVDGINQFIHRYPKIAEYINQSNADFISLQEMNTFMKDKLMPLLPKYDYVGDSREPYGESSGILYLKEYQLIETKTIWLSPTPETESKFEKSNFKRVATLGRFSKEDEIYQIVNTHLDYHSEEVQDQQMEVLLNSFNLDQMIITGDFNAVMKCPVHRRLEKAQYISVYQEDDLKKATYQEFKHITNGKPIDFVYYKGYKMKESAFIDQESCRDFMLSDHYPVVAYF